MADSTTQFQMVLDALRDEARDHGRHQAQADNEIIDMTLYIDDLEGEIDDLETLALKEMYKVDHMTEIAGEYCEALEDVVFERDSLEQSLHCGMAHQEHLREKLNVFEGYCNEQAQAIIGLQQAVDLKEGQLEMMEMEEDARQNGLMESKSVKRALKRAKKSEKKKQKRSPLAAPAVIRKW